MWFDAHHPGWGIGLVQQNDAVFATLFIYDASGAPVWYVASRMTNSGVAFDPCGSMALTGQLYRTNWPSFGSAQNPQGTMQVQSVGNFVVTVATAPGTAGSCDRNSASVLFSIDGALSTMQVTRQTWSTNQARLYGQFAGGLVFRTPASTCPDLNDYPMLPASGRQLSINGSADSSSPNGVRLIWGTGIDTVCAISGTYLQGGQLGSVAGTLSCGPIGGSSLTSVGPILLSSLYVSDSGFVGEITLDAYSCHYLGTLGGARRP
jgi:hypothetical protein